MEINNIGAFSAALELVRNATDYTMRGRQTIFEVAYNEAIGLRNACRVIGFTQRYVDALVEVDYDARKIKANRCHLEQKRKTVEHIINSDIDPVAALEYMYERDKTVLGLSSENKDDGSLTVAHDLDHTLGLFPCQTVGFKITKKDECLYLKERFGS
jgi:hypothetical protein